MTSTTQRAINMILEDLSHDNASQTVSFRGRALVTKTNKGWRYCDSADDVPAVLRYATHAAIWSLDETANAEDMRHRIGANVRE